MVLISLILINLNFSPPQSKTHCYAYACTHHNHNHEVRLGHLRIPCETRMEVAAQLQQGVTIERIHVMDNIRDNTMEGITLESTLLLNRMYTMSRTNTTYKRKCDEILKMTLLVCVLGKRTEISSKQPCSFVQTSRWASTWWYERCWGRWSRTWNTNTISPWHAVL